MRTSRISASLSMACLGAAIAILPGCGSTPRESTSSTSQGLDGEAIFRGVYFGTGDAADRVPELWNDKTRAQLAQARRGKETWKYSRVETATQFDTIADKLRAAGEGELAARVAQAATILRTMPDTAPSTERPTEAVVNDAIVTQIRRTSPNFYTQFAADMQSGNQLRVQVALRAATRAVFDSVAPKPALPKPPPTSLITPKDEGDPPPDDGSGDYSGYGDDPEALARKLPDPKKPWLWAINVVAAVNAVAVLNVAAAFLFIVISVPLAEGGDSVDQEANVDLLTKRFAQ
jgi:hypothetical protein